MKRLRRVSSLTVAFLFAGIVALRGTIGRAETPSVASAPPEVLPLDGGFAVELDGGFADGSLHGGVVVGIAVKNFVLGLSLDRFGSAAATYSDAAVSNTSEIRQVQVGIAGRVPIVSRGDGRVALFADLDMMLASRSAAGVDLN